MFLVPQSSPCLLPVLPLPQPFPLACSLVRSPPPTLTDVSTAPHEYPRASPSPFGRLSAPSSQKTQVQCGRNGRFLPSPSFTLFPSYVVPLSPLPVCPPVSVPLHRANSHRAMPYTHRVLSWLPFLLLFPFHPFFFSPFFVVTPTL